MIKILVIAGITAAAFASTPARAAQEPSAAPTASPRCEGNACLRRIAASCTIDRARRSARPCQQSASDMEKLGREQLDQLIASLN